MRTSTRPLLIRFVFKFRLLFTNPLTSAQIYGEDENIYGYSDLVIDVSFVTLWGHDLHG